MTLLIPASVKLPKSFVAIDLSEKVPDAFERNSNGKGKEHTMSEQEERGRSNEREEIASLIPIADENGEIISPEMKDTSPTSLPPPALDV
jgi:hypothetical protein